MAGEFKLLKIFSRDELLEPSVQDMEEPKIVGIYSFASKEILQDNIKLLYYKKPKKFPLDLKKGFESFRFREQPTNEKYFTKIEQYAMKTHDNFIENNIGKNRTPIVARRGVLCNIMGIPYLPRRNYKLIFYVTRYCGVIYIMDPRWCDEEVSHEFNDSYFAKFGQYCLVDSPEKEPSTDLPVDENEITLCMYNLNLLNFKLIYSGELAGIKSDQKVEDVKNVDTLNKCRFILTKLLWRDIDLTKGSVQLKFLKWWCQARLGKMSDIFLGFKEEDGIVHEPILHRRVEELPENQFWKPEVPPKFLHTFLSIIEEVMESVNCPYTVFEFEYEAVHRSIRYKEHKHKTEFSFLSDEFIEHLHKVNK